jgi:hypothetical protein
LQAGGHRFDPGPLHVNRNPATNYDAGLFICEKMYPKRTRLFDLAQPSRLGYDVIGSLLVTRMTAGQRASDKSAERPLAVTTKR